MKDFSQLYPFQRRSVLKPISIYPPTPCTHALTPFINSKNVFVGLQQAGPVAKYWWRARDHPGVYDPLRVDTTVDCTFQVAPVVESLPANVRDAREASLISLGGEEPLE